MKERQFYDQGLVFLCLLTIFCIFFFQVSPQFNPSHTPCHGQKRRLTRPRRHSVAVSKATLDYDKENANSDHFRTRMRKYNSLKFLGDRTAMTTVAEDVNISVDSETASENEAVVNNENAIDFTESPACNVNSSSKLNVQRKKSVVQNKTVKSGQGNVHRKRFNAGLLDETVKSRHCSDFSDTNHDRPHGKNSDDTLHDHNDKVQAPVKQLFRSQLQAIQITSDFGDVCEDLTLETTSQVPVKNKVIKDRLLLNEIAETSEEDVHSPVVRRSLRMKQMRSFFSIESTPKEREKTAQILAPDTPESRYGWSIRQKQLSKLVGNL